MLRNFYHTILLEQLKHMITSELTTTQSTKADYVLSYLMDQKVNKEWMLFEKMMLHMCKYVSTYLFL